MAKVIFTDDEREQAKATGSMLFAYFCQPPENSKLDHGGTYRAGKLTPTQAEDLDDAVLGTLRKLKTAAG